jgi:hypothetical protein
MEVSPSSCAVVAIGPSSSSKLRTWSHRLLCPERPVSEDHRQGQWRGGVQGRRVQVCIRCGCCTAASTTEWTPASPQTSAPVSSTGSRPRPGLYAPGVRTDCKSGQRVSSQPTFRRTSRESKIGTHGKGNLICMQIGHYVCPAHAGLHSGGLGCLKTRLECRLSRLESFL